MSYLVLARRYRPQDFDQIIGQEHITRTLKNALLSERLAHAFLFSGTRGVGKTTAARILAKAVNCLGPPEEAPCNKCASCIEINEGGSVDVQEIDGASNNNVDQVRELRENARYLPAKAKRKVYIIDEVHMLSNAAFNALLKTLEEPPDHVLFIFATTDVHKLPATILSRCQRYDFRPIAAGRIAAYLQELAASEKLDLTDGAASVLARSAKGSLRDALSLFDQAISFAGQAISEADVNQILGLVDPSLVWDLAAGVLSGRPAEVLAGLSAVVEHGYDLRAFHQELLSHFRNLILIKVDAVGGAETLGLSAQEAEELGAQAAGSTAESLQVCLQALLDAERTLRTTTQPRFALEAALLRLCHLTPVTGLNEILAQLNRLKNNLPDQPEAAPAPAPQSRPEPAAPAPERNYRPEPASAPERNHRPEPAPAPEPTPSPPEPEYYNNEPDYQPEPDYRAGPDYQDESGRQAGPGEQAESGLDPMADWPRFMDRLKQVNARLAGMISRLKPVSFEPPVLTLKNGSGFDLLEDKDRSELLSAEARRFFGRPMTFKLVNKRSSPRSDARREKRQLELEVRDHPLVRQAGDLFDGQLLKVDPDK